MVAATEQADADPVTVVLAWLQAHPRTVEVLGGPGLDHVSGVVEAPWPHLVVSEGPGGSLRDGTWAADQEISLELIGHPNGAPGKEALKKQALQLVRIVLDLPDQQVVTATTPVVSNARPSGVAVYRPLTSGQPAYTTSVFITIRPPAEALP